MKTLYDKKFRNAVRAGVQSSAAVLVPMLVDLFRPTTAIDVGCGEGWFVKELEAHGVRAIGADGPWVDDVVQVDFDDPPYPALAPVDLALCLEVAEHVKEPLADELVAWLVSLSPVVVFSAAIPGQGGVGHVNEQWPAYWAEKFAALGYEGTGVLRWQLWDDDRIEPWYRQNLLIFAAEPDIIAEHFSSGVQSVVHPGIWSVYR